MTTILLYAQPYNLDVQGFYFRSHEEYLKKSKGLKDSFGQPVEEFEIQFIDGDALDCSLAKVIRLSQATIARFYELADEWTDDQKTRYILAVDECGLDFDIDNENPDDIDIDIYEDKTLRDLAIRFVEDGLFGGVPERFQFYIDYDAIARDLAIDYGETTLNGETLIYRCR